MSLAAPAPPGATTTRRSRPGWVKTRRASALIAPLVLLAGLSACTDEPDPSTLPDGATLVSEAAAAMADLQTVHLEVELDPPIGDIPLARADIVLTAAGESAGDVQVEMGGQLVGVEMVTLANGDSYLKFPGTNWARSGLLAEFYDVSAILDPDRGIPKLLSTATNAKTEGSERVRGIDTWKVSLNLDTEVVERLVPATLPDGGLAGTVWLDKESKRLIKAIIMAPETSSSPGSEITFTITAFNEQVDIREPTN